MDRGMVEHTAIGILADMVTLMRAGNLFGKNHTVANLTRSIICEVGMINFHTDGYQLRI